METETRASQTEAPGLKPSHQSLNAQGVIKTLADFIFLSEKNIQNTLGLRMGVIIQTQGSYANHQ